MSSHTISLEALKNTFVEELILQVLREYQTLTILVPGEQEVIIEAKQKLEPLPILEGTIPADWKDAIYELA